MDSGSMEIKIIPITEYFNVDTHERYLKVKGLGLAKKLNTVSDETSLERDFSEKIKEKLYKKYYSRSKAGSLKEIRTDDMEGSWESKIIKKEVQDKQVVKKKVSASSFSRVPEFYKEPTVIPLPSGGGFGGSKGVGTSSALPCLMTLQPEVVAIPKQPSAPHFETNPKGYQLAKKWTQANNSQRDAFEKVKRDLFQVLVVGKGCKLRRIIEEFKEVTGEGLDLKQIGVPNVRTLLVQMEDLIILKKDRNGPTIYVLANMNSELSESYRHIIELIDEQRDPEQFVKSPAVLENFDIRELFGNPTWKDPTYFVNF